MATYDENGNVIENEAQNTEIFIDTDNNFADHEYDTDGIIIEEDNTNDNEQVMDFTQFDDNHTTYDDYDDDLSNETSNEVLEADKIAEQAKQNFETEFSDINDMIQQTQDSNIKEHDENTQDIATTTTIQPTATKEQEHEENKENHNNNNLDFLNKKVEKIENINDRDNLAYKTKEQFETEFSDINEILSLSNQLDNTLDNNMDNNPNNKAETRDTQDLDKKPINLEKEKENLDRALDNLVKVRSFADLIRALYMLDEALFAIKDKRERPEKNNVTKLLKDKMKKGAKLTKEYAVMAITEIKNLKGELDDYINTRRKEVEMQRNLSSQTKAYKLAISPKQKENHAIQIQKNMEYVNKELPDFRKNYPKTYERATETLKTYEKTKSKEKDVSKGRTL